MDPFSTSSDRRQLRQAEGRGKLARRWAPASHADLLHHGHGALGLAGDVSQADRLGLRKDRVRHGLLQDLEFIAALDGFRRIPTNFVKGFAVRSSSFAFCKAHWDLIEFKPFEPFNSFRGRKAVYKSIT
jgi:hypothetical protein